MTSNLPGSCCYTGVTHEGTAKGRYESYGDLEVYISEPKNAAPKKAILFMTDVLGHKFINTQLIADQFAANGYFAMVPDLFHGDPIPMNHTPDFDIPNWLHGGRNGGKVQHLPPSVDPVLDLCVVKLRDQYHIERIGAVGYCFGGKYVVRFLDDKRVNVGFIAHPAMVEKAELEVIAGPLAIAAAQEDITFPSDKRHESEDILGSTKVPWQISLYSGTVHGFAVRCDLSDPRQKQAKEAAFLQAVEWFDVHL